MHVLTRPSARTRALTGAVALAATAALALVGGAGPVTGSVVDDSARSADPCATDPATHTAMDAGSHLRVRPGSTNGEDPNSVTPAEAAAADRALQQRVEQMVENGRLRSSGQRYGTGPITIRTHVHVITKRNGTGAVPQSRIKRQIRVLNKAFAGRTAGASAATGIRFTLAGTTVTKKNAWYDWGVDPVTGAEDAQASTAKRALHKGGMATLNVYVAAVANGILGYASFPTSNAGALDGVVLLNESLPGGNLAPYNAGDTATHEVGHWLGLFHTFENGCTAPGDYISDTPYQANGPAIFYCGDDPELGDDTCPQPGKDPVHNFMGYGDDACLDRFTPKQAKRMTQSWMAFRDGR
jgi:Pregnancy-associated plasma protein-A